jgi:hypothetical protein
MTIYEVLNQTTEDTVFNTPEDIRPEVELALQDQFGEYESQWDEVKEKFGTWENFVDKVIEVLLTLDCDESWLDGEVYLQIEGVGQDILDGVEIGTRQNQLESIMGVNENGTLNRTSVFDGSECEDEDGIDDVVKSLF